MSTPKKVALVTGSCRGIGKAIAKELNAIGFFVIINGVSWSQLPDSFIEEFSDKKNAIKYIQADISSNQGRSKLIQTVKDQKRIDLLVNNAGVAPKERKDLLQATEESYDYVMNTNLKGPYFLTQDIAKFMVELKNKTISNYNPKIVNIGSISANTTSVFRGDYCISKAGIEMMTKLYADRLSEFNIPVFEVRPGIIKTDMTKAVNEKYDALFSKGLTPISRWGTPEDVAKCVAAISQDYFPYTTGQIFNIDGGFHLKRL